MQNAQKERHFFEGLSERLAFFSKIEYNRKVEIPRRKGHRYEKTHAGRRKQYFEPCFLRDPLIDKQSGNSHQCRLRFF